MISYEVRSGGISLAPTPNSTIQHFIGYSLGNEFSYCARNGDGRFNRWESLSSVTSHPILRVEKPALYIYMRTRGHSHQLSGMVRTSLNERPEMHKLLYITLRHAQDLKYV